MTNVNDEKNENTELPQEAQEVKKEVQEQIQEEVQSEDQASQEAVEPEVNEPESSSEETVEEVAVEEEEVKEAVAEAKKEDATNKNASAPQEKEDSGFIEKVISINRITKVTKGGKKLSFSALVVVGDTKGNVGYSLSKASEVATAIRKSMATAKKKMINVPMKGSTITHEIIGRCGGARVLLKPASEGTGVIASGPVRAVCDGAGIHNILTKCHRSNNPINVVKAALDGLSRLKTEEQ